MNQSEANYAQDDPAFQAYITTAASIVSCLQHGDDGLLAQLPQEFQEALLQRMKQRREELEDGRINQEEFDREIKAMVSVACIGLRQMAEGY